MRPAVFILGSVETAPSSSPFVGGLRWLAGGLLAAGILLRVLLAGHRLPINIDEVNVIDHALRLFAEGPNPRWFHYPSLHLYAVALLEGLLFGVRWILGLSPTPAAFADWYFADPWTVYVVARMWSVVTGIATVWVVYQLGVRLASPKVGLWSAVFLAVSPMHIYYSAIAKPDAAMVLAMCGAGLFAVRYLQERQPGLPWGPALLGGLGATVKYPGGIAWLVAPIALLLNSSRPRVGAWVRLKDISLLAAGAAAVFIAGTPFALVEPELVRRDVGGHVQTAAQGMPGMEGVTTWSLYLGSALPYALSLPILSLAVWGVVALLRRDWRYSAVALAPAALYAVPTFAASLAQFGFVLPLLPALCLCAGEGLDAARTSLPGRVGRQVLVEGVLVVLCVAFPLGASLCQQIRFQRPTAQEQTADWIRQQIPSGARIFGTATGMILPLTSERLAELLSEATRDRPTGGARMRFLQRTTPDGKGYYFYDMQGYESESRTGDPRLAEYDPEWIGRNGFQYVVDSEEKMRRFFGRPEKYPWPFQFERWLADHGELVFTTHPGSRGLPDWVDDPLRVRDIEPLCGFVGSELRVYRIREDGRRGGFMHGG